MQATRGTPTQVSSVAHASHSTPEDGGNKLPEYLYQVAIVLAVLMILWTVAA